MKLMFCMFAEDIGLLPPGVLAAAGDGRQGEPGACLTPAGLANLFAAMSQGGIFGADDILCFNGGLFADADVIHLTRRRNPHPGRRQQTSIGAASSRRSSARSFERTLDPEKRAQIGAHYTSREDIETLLEPVMMVPLRREWEAVQASAGRALAGGRQGRPAQGPAAKRQRQDPAAATRRRPRDPRLRRTAGARRGPRPGLRLRQLPLRGPAHAAGPGEGGHRLRGHAGLGLLPQVRPTQLHGIEINPYAQQLAQVVIWIGYLQWMHHNGFKPPDNPVLEPIDSIRRMDAILDLSDPENPKEPEWPEVDFIVGNPPFLGGKLLRANWATTTWTPCSASGASASAPEADLCCYWFEKARAQIALTETGERACLRRRAFAAEQPRGAEADQGDGGHLLRRSDRDWILDGANVHVSMVGFDDGAEIPRVLDGKRVSNITASLTATVDVQAR